MLDLVSHHRLGQVPAERWPAVSATLPGFVLEKKQKCEGCCVNVSETLE
jgi:hypothetical protein